MRVRALPLLVGLAVGIAPASSAPVFDAHWQAWAEARVADLESRGARQPIHPATWADHRDAERAALRDMLGLHPEPPRGDLRVTFTGRHERDGVQVDLLHFQSLPGLYVTANYWRPAGAADTPRPTVLYLCGHGVQKDADGRSNGNKTHYQHHGAWFAAHGYNCLILDTVQWGEILGQHWGTYRLDRWWWVSRGYTPAGVETWSALRGLDFLLARPEVDPARIGVTGRSGGGAYAWFIAALDDRVAVAAPTAGITHLRDHVLAGCIAGHCDCMYMLNTRRWDFDRLAALTAPRPLLVVNTDRDPIFPLAGVQWIHASLRRVYQGLGVPAQLGLHVVEGGHQDLQTVHWGVFHWFERHLKGTPATAFLERPARKLFEPRELRVFDALPADEINTRVDEVFVPAATEPPVPENAATWATLRQRWLAALEEDVFRWSDAPRQPPPATDPGLHGRRALLLLGDPLDCLRVGDLVRRHRDAPEGPALTAAGRDAAHLLYASLFLPGERALVLRDLPRSHATDGPAYPGVLRHLDLPQALALAAARRPVRVIGDPSHWDWSRRTAALHGFADRLILDPAP
jgi:dienelactone hydrolase